MKYMKQCPFLILLVLTAAAAAALRCYGWQYSDIERLAESALQTVHGLTSAAASEAAAAEERTPETLSKADIEEQQHREDAPEPDASKTDTAAGVGDAPAAPASKESAPEPEQKAPRYELAQVEDDYFNDAVFIGDSRTVGLSQYGDMPQAAFYAETGFTVYKFSSAGIVPIPDSKEKMTVEEALSQNQFGKVYLMVGINEMGRGTLEEFTAEYTRVVERIAELQPDAIIILEAIMYVGKNKSESDPVFNNSNIAARNEAIARLSDNRKIFYFDMNPTVTDEEGNLRKEYSFDGVHLRGQYVRIWKDYLYANGVVEAE